jgi:hypothetical protein
VSSVIVRPWLVLLQTSIITDGFRSLAEGEQVEFYVESGDDGLTKAVQVTGPGGAPPQVFQIKLLRCARTLRLLPPLWTDSCLAHCDTSVRDAVIVLESGSALRQALLENFLCRPRVGRASQSINRSAGSRVD